MSTRLTVCAPLGLLFGFALALAFSLCETPLGDYSKAEAHETSVRPNQSHCPKADEFEDSGGTPQPFARYRIPGHQSIERSGFDSARNQGSNFRGCKEV